MSEFLDPNKEIRKHGAILPHWDQDNAMQFVTFRLADAMPATKLRIWKEEYAAWKTVHPKPWSPSVEQEHLERFVWKLENWLDEGSGSCLLSDSSLRDHLEETLMHDEGTRVVHHSWVIMPNHVHVLFEVGEVPMAKQMQQWKGATARAANMILNTQDSFWQPDYWDTYMRDPEHEERTIRYIRNNPVKAGLVPEWKAWPWSFVRSDE